jgi:hypothetical protein
VSDIKPMTADDLHAITTASAGLRGLFVHLPATGNVVFSPRDSDELHAIAEDLEPHVAEPLVVMLDGVPGLLAEVDRLTQVHETAAALSEARRQRINGMVRQIERFGHESDRLRAELESLAPHTRDSETEPDAEVLAAPARCDCCSVVIPADESAVMFLDESGRACWAHYARCPEPEMWTVVLRWWDEDDGCWGTSRKDPRPYEDAHVVAHRFRRIATTHPISVRLVRVRKEVTRG